MKLRKIAFILIMTIAITIVASIFNVSSAIDKTEWYLKISQFHESGYGYKAFEKIIWEICEAESSGTIKNHKDTIYCLRGGPGFGSRDMNSGDPKVKLYSKSFDMKKPETITGKYKEALSKVIDTENYNALLWLLDNIYVAPKTDDGAEKLNAEEYKSKLLANADIDTPYITDEDIDAVQQLAVWHFTNDDEYKVEKNSEEGTFSLYINTIANDKNGYQPLSDEKGPGATNGEYRQEDCQKLYTYLVTTAEAEGKTYDKTKQPGVPYELDKSTVAQQKEQGDNYVIGPFKINQKENSRGTLTLTVKNGTQEIKPVTLQKAGGDTYSSVEETIGEDFYIVVPKSTAADKISVEIGGVYDTTTLTYWSVDADRPENDYATEQPVVEVKKESIPYTDNVEYTIVKPEKKFDLALRKFITAVNGEAPSVSREPKISNEELQALKNGNKTTATKVHPKNALSVKTNDVVRYTIRVYNEGEVDGYVDKITDYLPEGLEFIDNEFNQGNGWKQASDDENKIETEKLKGQKIAAFNKDTLVLSYLDVEIECKVIATAQNQTTKGLKNIAEITAHHDEENNSKVKDRDSDPGNVKTEIYGTTSQEDDDDFEQLIIDTDFDLALRKFITAINGKAPTVSREPQISNEQLEALKNGATKTATKTHPKNALLVETNDIVRYKIRVYNEGNVDGYVDTITDYLPEGLEFIDNQFNRDNGWSNPSNDGKTIVTDKLKGQKIEAFNKDTLKLSYLDVEIECKVIATTQENDKVLKNIAEITAHHDSANNSTVKDRDSDPNNVNRNTYGTTSQEDDDDFEQLVLPGKVFDLALRKFISEINGTPLVEEDGSYSREPKVDVTPLLNGENTAIYNHTKKTLHVNVGDIVTYTIRVYNEGEIDGYVQEITDYLPEWLEFINDEENAAYGWKISSDGRKVTTDITSYNTAYSASRDTIYADREGSNKTLLKAFDTTQEKLDYIDVKIKCKVLDTVIAQKITNIAEITAHSDKDKNSNVVDRDSTPDDVTLPTDDTLPNYKDTEIESGKEYIPGQEDDDDFEKVIVEKFDLALRKFITAVNDQAITNRVPVFSTDSNRHYTYTHPKTPVEVANGDIVTYTLRIYNEGNVAGYASEVEDDLPEGLLFLPENAINTEYRWVMYDEEGQVTTNVEEAKTIKTDYLSKEQADATGRDNLIDAFDTNNMTQPDYRELKIAFKVVEPNTSDRVLVNVAEITDDSDEEGKPIEDEDSTPDNNNEDEDDIDKEYVKVKYFDLALEKIVTQYKITLDGKTRTTKTGHKFGVQPEPTVKVELSKNAVKNAVLKFTYQIKVTNEGEIEGYVDEIRDYVPEGLEFVQADNPKWRKSENGTVVTDQLKGTLLKPGESATVEIVFKWKNASDNFGLKQNWAEISKDRNNSNTPDIDSTPDNNKKGEDDIDDASVILSVITGAGDNYIGIIAGVLVILTAGIILIKKFVI